MKNDILIFGGSGHIGLPLGLLFASKNKKVVLYDLNKKNINIIKNKKIPFMENNGQLFLNKYFHNITATSDPSYIAKTKVIIICIGTLVKNSKPELKKFLKDISKIKKYINKNHTIIIRSSIYPGTCEKVKKIFKNVNNNISYCPERVVQGKTLEELPKLPQIISGINKNSINNAKKIFNLICKKTIVTSILEAELIKLFSNAWRYINFSISNQFYMICEKYNINFDQLRNKMIEGYDRNKDMPKAGFAAGPCLFKDTAQLNSFLKNEFTLGKTATKINQNFPKFIYEIIYKKYKSKLFKKKIGILGMSFKSDIDDIRDSLSISLLKLFKKKRLKVKISDEYALLPGIIDKNKLINESDIIIVGVPHSNYKKIRIPKNKFVVDSWGLFER